MLTEIMASKYPAVLYESKHRIIKLLEELATMSRELKITVEVTVARELTKMHESFYQGSPADILEKLTADANNLKGEFVVLVRRLKDND